MISNSDESDEGKYECVARNSHGLVHSRAAHLYVKGIKGPREMSTNIPSLLPPVNA